LHGADRSRPRGRRAPLRRLPARRGHPTEGGTGRLMAFRGDSEQMTRKERLGIGFIGSAFITRFHMRSWAGVRDADIRGVYSPNRSRAEEAAALARSLHVGEARAFSSIEEMVMAPEIDCLWICGPN